MNPLLAAARRFAGDPLDDDEARAFAATSADTNARRLRVLLPLMVLVHVAHTALYHLTDAERRTLDPVVVLWRQGVVAAHVTTLVLALALFALVWRRSRFTPLAAPLAAVLYLVHGAVCSAFDQLVVHNASAYIGYAFGIAVVVALAPREALLAYAVGLAAFVAGVAALQPDPNARASAIAAAASSSAVGLVLAFLLHGARRRDFRQRATIDKQKAELAALNAALERRVQEQVAEIVKRADEVHALNAQLRARVRDRSNELSLALSRLALRRDVDGTLPEGTVLGERFEIGALLGSGGMGAVYQGVDRSTGARVAVKVIQASSARQLDALHRFLREARTAATVEHPAVVRALHVDIGDDGMLYQVQELVDGEDLERRLANEGPAPAAEAARIVSVLCEALAAAHAAGVVHRDVKPSNVMLTSTPPGVKLLDFGIAKLQQSHDDDDAHSLATDRGFVLGTPAYMAPEQRDGGAVTDKSDVYAVGVLLFRTLAGRLPFEERTLKVRSGPATPSTPDVRALDPAVDDKLAAVVARCLRSDPAERPTAAALAAELHAFGAAGPARAVAPPPVR